MKEQWKVCVSDTNYKISNLGKVKRLHSVRGGKAGLLVFKQGSKDYWHFSGKRIAVHREVLLVFVGQPESNKNMACHKNDIRHDNRLCNLYWGDRSSNIIDASINKKVVFRAFFTGHKHSEQSRSKMSLKRKGKPNPRKTK